MLAFSTAADVVQPSQIGTSAAIVNGIMFIVGGIMISRPGVRIGLGIDAGIEPKSLELAQYASRPLMLAIVVALAIASPCARPIRNEHVRLMTLRVDCTCLMTWIGTDEGATAAPRSKAVVASPGG